MYEIRSSEGYFYEVVTAALGRTQVTVSEHAEFYLVGLLDSLAKGPGDLPSRSSEPLAIRLLDRTREPRTLVLKDLGDTALVVTGFFPEAMPRYRLTESYLEGLGRSAYKELSDRVSLSVLSEIFDELAVEFAKFVGVLAEARTLVASDL